MHSWLKQHVQCDVFVCAVPLLCISWLRCSYFPLAVVLGLQGSSGKETIVSSERNSAQNSSIVQMNPRVDKKTIAEHICLPTSDQSRASHSGGQLLLLQGSVSEGRGGVQAESSRTFSSVEEILLLHKTSRLRRPLLQLRLHSDHSPVHQLKTKRCF